MHLLAVLILLAGTPAETRPIAPPPSPAEARAGLHVDPGLRVELAASEPEISSPVAAAFDEDGRLWVVEMLDYPVPDPDRPPQGRIKVLEDADGDGRFEKSRVFAEGLLLANGLLPWKGGLIVTAAPQILFLKDTDGDGKADVREPLYEGFSAGNPQLRVSHPTLGIDNWIYVANGQRGGKIRRSGGARPRDSAPKPIDINGMDFRFDLLHEREEAVTGFGQFGLTFDDWGQRFVCTNRNHLIHLVVPNRYFQRNPHAAAPPPLSDNQGAGGAARVYPLSRNFTLSTVHTGTFTASCGITVYRGSLLPEEYRGRVFTCEPTGNLVRQEVLTPSGATFAHRMPREGVEFLASKDEWFRPVSMAHGPDGALYVVDMCRSEVEHPEWVPADLKPRYDFKGRKDLGRIWRIVPDNRPAAARSTGRTSLGKASAAELAATLESRDGWRRMTAHRLLLERQDPAAEAPLRRIVESSKEPLARLHAAWLLDVREKLDLPAVERLLADPHPRVREAGVLFSEKRIGGSAALEERLIALADDPDGRVRFQTALSLGEWDSERILEPLLKIGRAGADDRWTRLAVATAVPTRAGLLLERVEDPRLLRELAAVVGSRNDGAETAAVLERLPSLEGARPLVILQGLAEGLGRRGKQLSAVLEAQASSKIREGANKLLEKAADAAADGRLAIADRLDALRLLSHLPWSAAAPALGRLLAGDQPLEIRTAAVSAISAHQRPEAARLLLVAWKKAPPALRREILEALSRRPERILALLDEVEAGGIAPGELGAPLLKSLVSDNRADIRERAALLLKDSLPGDRKEVLERYQAALALPGDAAKGLEVFRKNCGACHRVLGVGAQVGPDISDTLQKGREVLLADILDPNRAIDAHYLSYVARKKDGTVLTGILAAVTASSFTLRRGEGQEDVVLRQDIAELSSSGLSLMPEGVEQTISIEEMADLLAFLKGWRFLGDRAGEKGAADRAPAPRATAPLLQAHAHNDYEHVRPLLDALDHGFTSVEADIYLVDGKLLVAHDRPDVRSERTLEALYLDPLLSRVRANGGSVQKDGPELTLLIDIKSDGADTYRALREVLARYAEMLSSVDSSVGGGRLEVKAVRVIISGNRPLELLKEEKLRLAGYDGRLSDLDSAEPAHLIPLISDRWGAHFQWSGAPAAGASRAIEPFPPLEKAKLRAIVKQAHDRGRRLRFWATPENPAVWGELLDAGVDLIGTDDLPALQRFLLAQKRK